MDCEKIMYFNFIYKMAAKLFSVCSRHSTYSLSPSVGEVLPQQQTQLSGDSHVDVLPASLSTLQLLTEKTRTENVNRCKLVCNDSSLFPR